ncbi:DUF3990 domain-containing protein [Listeria booriae]|uniref:DUF3990 domain-containing protein n=1 Tax=Listeria booriae TaxID=1552123 RepID=UPI0016259097|nr:DUF3990 domain-containing protein [Listeria booriae]MBC1235493.1 DUF3990 domain-containing protein [Listeria booriae]MBC1248205.1 DUF3990 domain-containing protein [Listeria booriae]MBC1274325.1 DUF3990 domain-containing protein [Listeria booriae]
MREHKEDDAIKIFHFIDHIMEGRVWYGRGSDLKKRLRNAMDRDYEGYNGKIHYHPSDNSYVAPENFQKLYHGTTMNCAKSIQTKIKFELCRDRTDFGKGFYLTTNFNQAKNWAIRQYNNEMKKGNVTNTPVVVAFDFKEMEAYNICSIKEFIAVNEEWSDFVYNERKDGINRIHKFDIVKGPLADGKTLTVTKKRKRGRINSDEYLKEIKSRKKHENQISFHTDKSLEFLKFKEVHDIGE